MFSVPFFKKSYPALDWIQIEITSYCNADCIYCPHTAYRKSWQNRYLPLKSFQNLIPALPKSNLIYLQGWGEPFIHPDFMDIINHVDPSIGKIFTHGAVEYTNEVLRKQGIKINKTHKTI